MPKTEYTIDVKLSLLAFLLLLLPSSAIWSGFVLHKLWAWFVVPLGVAPVSTAHAIGLTCVLGLFTRLPKEDFIERIGRKAGTAFMVPALVLFFGWIVTFFL